MKIKLNTKEAKLLAIMYLKDVGTWTLRALATKCWPNNKRRNSWVRNSMRKLVGGGVAKKVARGTYKLTANGRKLGSPTKSRKPRKPSTKVSMADRIMVALKNNPNTDRELASRLFAPMASIRRARKSLGKKVVEHSTGPNRMTRWTLAA
jgi:hypothetical protein